MVGQCILGDGEASPNCTAGTLAERCCRSRLRMACVACQDKELHAMG
jgi:hypothetical protein